MNASKKDNMPRKFLGYSMLKIQYERKQMVIAFTTLLQGIHNTAAGGYVCAVSKHSKGGESSEDIFITTVSDVRIWCCPLGVGQQRFIPQ